MEHCSTVFLSYSPFTIHSYSFLFCSNGHCRYILPLTPFITLFLFVSLISWLGLLVNTATLVHCTFVESTPVLAYPTVYFPCLTLSSRAPSWLLLSRNDPILVLGRQLRRALHTIGCHSACWLIQWRACPTVLYQRGRRLHGARSRLTCTQP